MKLFTIGFTKKTAEEFFSKLINAGVKCVIDIRLWNTSSLAGFTRKNDLEYFLKKIGDIEYLHLTDFAPSEQLLDGYKKGKISWEDYETEFNILLKKRVPEKKISADILDNSCLLCSEPGPDKCHRRLVAEYLAQKIGNIEMVHL